MKRLNSKQRRIRFINSHKALISYVNGYIYNENYLYPFVKKMINDAIKKQICEDLGIIKLNPYGLWLMTTKWKFKRK